VLDGENLFRQPIPDPSLWNAINVFLCHLREKKGKRGKGFWSFDWRVWRLEPIDFRVSNPRSPIFSAVLESAVPPKHIFFTLSQENNASTSKSKNTSMKNSNISLKSN